MNDTDFEERFDRLEKHLETVAKQIDVLARATEREFRDLHHSINHRFERVSARLETIEARIEVFSRRMDDEVEQRHKLAERLSNLERSVGASPKSKTERRPHEASFLSFKYIHKDVDAVASPAKADIRTRPAGSH
jgi:DNA repair ATPase RecN